MIAQFVRLSAVACIAVVVASPAKADWNDNCVAQFFNSIARDVKRRQCWPKPFTCPDRQAVRAPFATMVSNGWRRQNLIDDYHFDPQTGELTEAGRMKVRWVLREAPEQHRILYVHCGENVQETTARLDVVRQHAVTILPHGQLPIIMETDIPSGGWSAATIDAVGRKYLESVPLPVLPPPTGSSTD